MPHRQKEARLREYAQKLSDVIDELKSQRQQKGQPPDSAEFRAFANALPGVVWVTGADGIPTFHSRQWHERFCVGSNYLDILHPDDRARVSEAWAASIATGQPYCQIARFMAKDGCYVSLLTHAHPIRGFDGAILSWVGSSSEMPASIAPELRSVA